MIECASEDEQITVALGVRASRDYIYIGCFKILSRKAIVSACVTGLFVSGRNATNFSILIKALAR